MLSLATTRQLSELGIEASQANDFHSGVKLMQLVCSVFYQGHNPALASKLRLSEDHKTGNDVININIILGHLKKDSSVTIDPQIRELTAFRIIEEAEAMIKIVEWLLTKRAVSKPTPVKGDSKHTPKNVLTHEMSPPREQENEFDNLYFVSSIEKKEQIFNESLVEENPIEKVVRKGSFKVIKPKVTTDSKSQREDSQEKVQLESAKIEMQQPLRELVVINSNNIRDIEDREELACRKTIPKMSEKPPLYRSKQKPVEPKQEKKEKETPPDTTSRVQGREDLLKHIDNIKKQIVEEEKSLTNLTAEDVQAKKDKSHRKSNRKIFKITLPEVPEAKKKALLEWLISINLLNANSTKHLHELQTICKDGVIFMEAVSYCRGRGKDICFFRQPKKSAQLHSNYQKLFAILQQIPEFRSELLHQYEYFIPEAQPNAFWNLLSCIYSCFYRENKPKDTKVIRYDSTIKNKLDRDSSKKLPLNESVSYHQIKYNSNSAKREGKSNFSSVEIPRKETPKPATQSQEKSSSKERPREEDLYESKAFCGLIQNEEPADDPNRTERSYKDIYLCKFKNVSVQTPQKNRSFANSSLSKSRLRLSIGSSKKKQSKPAMPSVSLQMQMKVLKYLKAYPTEEENQQLFKDPYRNGVLLCQIVKKQLGKDCFVCKKPKSIDDCRENFASCIQTIKRSKKDLGVDYDLFIEDLVKGEKSLLIGLIWHLIKDEPKSVTPEIRLPHDERSLSRERGEQATISWVRSLEKNSSEIAALKIRNQQVLYISLINTDFLFHYSWLVTGKRAVTPTYDRPSTNVQRESNLKKVLGYLVQSKIIRSDYLWRTKAMVERQNGVLQQLVGDLITHYNHLHKKEQSKTINFVKYLKKDDSESREKKQERLETTMANQTLNHPTAQPIQEQPKIEINWMRKLGFVGNLELNSGVVFARLISRLNMKTIDGINEHPQSKAECLGNIRRAIKAISKFRWDEYDIYEANYERNLEVYAFLRDRYKHAYALKAL